MGKATSRTVFDLGLPAREGTLSPDAPPLSAREPYGHPMATGQRESLSPRHQVGSWYPVIPVKVVPPGAGGDNAGTISAEVAKAKAELEYERYHTLQDAKPRAIDAAFEATAKQLKKPAPTHGKKGRGKG